MIDLGWITAGAGSSALLHDLGADVVKVEGPGALDPFRTWGGASQAAEWWNRSPFYAATNRGKRSVCLDLKHADGRAALLLMLNSADVMVENFRRGVLDTLGLAPAMLRRRFPRLIIASISSQGEDGPDAHRVSFGSTLEATSGLAALTGPGASPVVTGRELNYPDQVVCLFAAGAIVAALLERDRTGAGAHLDLSQRELTSFLLGEALVEAATGAQCVRRGNDDLDAPGEHLVRCGAGWHVRGPSGTSPLRSGAAVDASPELRRGTALLRDGAGLVAKGVPFRMRSQPRPVLEPCRTLGADNRAALREAGLDDASIDALEQSRVLATAPRL